MFEHTLRRIALVIPFLALACGNNDVTGIRGPETPQTPESVARNATARPLRGRIEGAAVAGAPCSIDPAGVMITATGEGWISHFGTTTLLQTACVAVADFTPIGPSGASLTAANGDRLDGALVGLTGRPDGFEMQVVITGGTGRFAHATGAYSVEVVQAAPLQPFSASINGFVRY